MKILRTMVSVQVLCSIHALYCFPTNYVNTTEVQNGGVPQGLAHLSCGATIPSCQATTWAQTSARPTSPEFRELRDSQLQHAGPQQSPAEIQLHISGDLGHSLQLRSRPSGTRKQTLDCSSQPCQRNPHHERKMRCCYLPYLPQSAEKFTEALLRWMSP